MQNIKVFNRIEDLTHRDPKNLTQRALKTCEESGELAAAVLSCTMDDYKKKRNVDILLECADVIMCAISVGVEAGFSLSEIEKGLDSKLDKWEKVIDDKE
jgi:NTP pyrophosphatase (non-canonical NTP hydrolase)